MTAAMKMQGTCLQCFVVLALIGSAGQAAGQALSTHRLGNGTELVVVAQPLADATTVVWPGPVGGEVSYQAVTSGDLTLVAAVESALQVDVGSGAPPVIVAVGRAAVADLRTLLERLLSERPPRPVPPAVDRQVEEGRFERRLGAPGSEAEIRLEVNLPPPTDPTRSDVEVLWDLLPALLGDDLTAARSRTEGDLALLEAQTESSSADLTLRRLRFGLAQLADNPAVQGDLIEPAAARLRVRRQAMLEKHPNSAELILELWLEGGVAAVGEFLFGVDGVTATTVRSAAAAWLPQHPGNIVISLPPRAFNPRFASPPLMLQLDNGLSAAVLERTGVPLATLCLRPVVVPDLDGELAATILARVARELRELEHRPGWVEVNSDPPQLQLAAPPDQFSELAEVLRAALARAEDDERPVMVEGGSARRRALRLMAGILGVAEGSSLSPATLIRTGNLALGMVAEDGEAASEAVRKFWAVEGPAVDSAAVRSLPPVPRTREAAAGEESVLVVAVELAAAVDESLAAVVAELLRSRGAELLGEGTVEVLEPFVPGRHVLLVVATATGSIDELESKLRTGWARYTRAATASELEAVRRRVAATSAATWSGVSGRACRCAAVASGAAGWRTAADLEMTILSLQPELVNATLAAVAKWESLLNTGAGVLPIATTDRNSRSPS